MDEKNYVRSGTITEHIKKILLDEPDKMQYVGNFDELQLMEKLKQYVDDSIFGDNKLIWNSLKQKVSKDIVTFTYDEGVEKVRKLASKELVLYDERQKLIQKVTIADILEVLSSLEVWEEKDLYVFDTSLEWFIVFTHEDMVMVYGI